MKYKCKEINCTKEVYKKGNRCYSCANKNSFINKVYYD